eukprot:jgi/Chrzof1/11364/Cz05g34040.t1
MYLYGGVYADLDLECLQSIEDLLAGHDVVLAYMGSDRDFAHCIPNAFMASVPRHPFWLMMLDMIQANWDSQEGPELITGPVALKRTVEEMWVPSNGTGLHILNQKHIFPFNWAENTEEEYTYCSAESNNFSSLRCQEMYPDAYAISYWSHSWE